MRHRGHALQPLTLSVQDPAARGAAPSQPQPAALGVHSLAVQILRLGIPAVSCHGRGADGAQTEAGGSRCTQALPSQARG